VPEAKRAQNTTGWNEGRWPREQDRGLPGGLYLGRLTVPNLRHYPMRSETPQRCQEPLSTTVYSTVYNFDALTDMEELHIQKLW
jgi:hypothetical protein